MHQKCKTLSGQVILFTLIPAIFLLLYQNVFAASETTLPHTDAVHPVLSALDSLYEVVTTIFSTISNLYFSYIHETVTTVIAAFWPPGWPQYTPMLTAYQGLFHTVPFWFTDTLWPSSFFGKFPRWGIDLFIITEIFYIALRLVTRKAAPFQGSRLVRFLKMMAYETWVFVKAPFFALASIISFLMKDEQGKRRILLFWFYTILILTIVVALVAWRANAIVGT